MQANFRIKSELRRSLDAEDRGSKGENQATGGELGGWTKESANRIARLIRLRHSDKLDTTNKICLGKPVPTLASTRHMAEEEDYEVEDGGIWLQPSVPALYRPHSDRPSGSRCYER